MYVVSKMRLSPGNMNERAQIQIPGTRFVLLTSAMSRNRTQTIGVFMENVGQHNLNPVKCFISLYVCLTGILVANSITNFTIGFI